MSKINFHLKSMTAYGRGVTTFPYGTLSAEIQSVNRRYLEVNVNLPRLLTRFETALRKKVAARVGRGMVNLFISWRSDAQTPVKVLPNLSLAKGVKTAYEQIAYDLGIDPKMDLSLLAGQKDLLLFEEEIPEEAGFEAALEQSLDGALDAFLEMKENEGKTLSKDLYERTESLNGMLEVIEKLAPGGTEKYRQKLTDRLAELFEGSLENEERILREVALYAERIDITEELVRFKSHIEQFRQMLEKPLEDATETRGKSLDFMIQELNREINTIGSKGSDLAITQQVVKAKSELEKMREQVQNIE